MRWGIIGAGDIAGRGFAPALSRAADTKLAAVQCRTLDKAQAFAQKHSAAKAYDSIEALLADPAVDAVYIATPNSLHAPHTIAAANAGKHVLCEKPMATTVRDAEAMIEACERNRVKLGVVFQNRYHEAHLEAKLLVEAGALGEVELATAQLCRGFATRNAHWSGWRRNLSMAGAGAIVGHAVHPIDLLRHLLGAEVREVQAMTDEAPPERPIDEMCYALLKFSNGTHGVVIAGTLLPQYDNDAVLYGSKAKVACRSTMGNVRPDARTDMTIETPGAKVSTHFGDNSQAAKMTRMVVHFSRSVHDGSEPTLSGANGLQMVRIALAVQQSARERRAIVID